MDLERKYKIFEEQSEVIPKALYCYPFCFLSTKTVCIINVWGCAEILPKFPLCNKCSLTFRRKRRIPGWKAVKFVAYCMPCSKEAFEQGTQYSTHAVGGNGGKKRWWNVVVFFRENRRRAVKKASWIKRWRLLFTENRVNFSIKDRLLRELVLNHFEEKLLSQFLV